MKRLIPILATVLAICSCATNRYIAPDLAGNLDEVAILTPFTYVEFLDAKGEVAYDDSLSAVCAQLITNALLQSPLPTGRMIPVDLAGEDPTFRDAIASLREIDPKKAGEIPIPQELDRLLEENGQRYGVVVFANGFTRDRKDYGKKMALGLGMAILTTAISLGTVTAYSIPEKSILRTWIGILDAETDQFVFYNRRTAEDAEPTKIKHVSDQIRRLLKDFE